MGAIHFVGYLIVVTVMIPPAAFAQMSSAQIAPRDGGFFLEESYIFFHGFEDLLMEAQIAPHLPISNLTLDQRVTGQRVSGSNLVLAVTPMVRLRIYDTPSTPVRSPSFVPQVNLTLVRYSYQNAYRSLLLRFTLGHHSNGQDGCLFSDGRLPGEDCAGPDTASINDPAGHRINRQNGSFSTNYYRALVGYSHDNLPTPETSGHSWAAFAGFEHHPTWLLPFVNSIRPEIRRLYGDTRVSVGVEGHWWFPIPEPRDSLYDGTPDPTSYVSIDAGGSCRLLNVIPCPRIRAVSAKVISEFNPRVTGDIPKVNRMVQLSVGIGHDAGWAVLARCRAGQDYYNLAFRERIKDSCVLGVTWQRGIPAN